MLISRLIGWIEFLSWSVYSSNPRPEPMLKPRRARRLCPVTASTAKRAKNPIMAALEFIFSAKSTKPKMEGGADGWTGGTETPGGGFVEKFDARTITDECLKVVDAREAENRSCEDATARGRKVNPDELEICIMVAILIGDYSCERKANHTIPVRTPSLVRSGETRAIHSRNEVVYTPFDAMHNFYWSPQSKPYHLSEARRDGCRKKRAKEPRPILFI